VVPYREVQGSFRQSSVGAAMSGRGKGGSRSNRNLQGVVRKIRKRGFNGIEWISDLKKGFSSLVLQGGSQS